MLDNTTNIKKEANSSETTKKIKDLRDLSL